MASALAGEAFATGIVAELDTALGLLSWVNAGHPEPLLLRGGRLVKSLHAEAHMPFGLWADLEATSQVRVGSESLEPADIILLYSDGVVEARSPDGNLFGQDRLVDLITRNLAAGLPAPETMRRLVKTLLEYQQDQLSDDATMLMVQWRTPTPTDYLT